MSFFTRKCPSTRGYRIRERGRAAVPAGERQPTRIADVKRAHIRSINRVRRVKCDEGKPACARCSSTGRACEWFVNSRASEPRSDAKAPVTLTTPALSSVRSELLSHLPEAKALELRGFEFFLTRTAPEISYFHSDFWESLVLQLSWSDPLVLHAAIALGTLHENEERHGMPVPKDKVSDARHRFAVAQYNTAIRLLRCRNLRGDATSRIAILVTCLIFIHIELLRGWNHVAIAHIRNGLRILGSSELCSTHEEVKSILTEAFRGPDLQTAHFGLEGPYIQYDIDKLDAIEPLTSRTDVALLTQAKRKCHILLGHAFRLLEVSRAHWDGERRFDEAMFARQQSRLLALYDQFRSELDTLARMPNLVGSRKNWLSVILMKMHAISGSIAVAACVAEDDHKAYAARLDDFTEIIALAKQFISNVTGPSNRHSLSTDGAIIQPLFCTAIRCDDSVIRHSAMALLESWCRREGFWSSNYHVKIARLVVKTEEERVADLPQHLSMKGLRRALYVNVAEDQTFSVVTFERSAWLSSMASGAEQLRIPH